METETRTAYSVVCHEDWSLWLLGGEADRVMESGAKTDLALVCHWPHDKTYWLDEALSGKGFRVARFSAKWGRRSRDIGRAEAYVRALRLGLRAAWFADTRGTAVVADYDGHHAGVFAAIAPPIRGLRRRPVLCANLILRDKPGMRTTVWRLLYRMALRNPRAFFTVGSAPLRQYYAILFRAEQDRFLVLPDCFAPGHRACVQHDSSSDGGYVFVGGLGARDWQSSVAVADACPDIPFLFVARERWWPGLAVPPNVELKFDIPLAEFHEAMRNARIVLVLLTDAVMTAGLIVVTHAALMGTPVVATRTAATVDYFPDEGAKHLVPIADVAAAVSLVRHYWHDADDRRRAAEDLRLHVEAFHSPEAYATAMAEIIRGLPKATVAPVDVTAPVG